MLCLCFLSLSLSPHLLLRDFFFAELMSSQRDGKFEEARQACSIGGGVLAS